MFLTHKQDQILAQMAVTRTQKYRNSKDNLVSGKLMLFGENVVKLVRCEILTSKVNTTYLSLIFTCKPRKVHTLKTKLTFTPYQEFCFTEESVKDICKAFGHDLRDKPDDMDLNVYLRHVGARIGTFVGQEIKVVIGHEKVLKIDEYGFTVRSIIYKEDSRDLAYYRVKMLFNQICDWNMLHNILIGDKHVL